MVMAKRQGVELELEFMYMDISNNEGVSAPLIPKLYLKINLVLMKEKCSFWCND